MAENIDLSNITAEWSFRIDAASETSACVALCIPYLWYCGHVFGSYKVRLDRIVAIGMPLLVGPGHFSRYSDSLQGSRSGNQIPVGARFSAPVLIDPEIHPASYTMGTASLSRGVKRPGRGVNHQPPFSAEVKEEKWYLSSLSVPSGLLLAVLLPCWIFYVPWSLCQPRTLFDVKWIIYLKKGCNCSSSTFLVIHFRFN